MQPSLRCSHRHRHTHTASRRPRLRRHTHTHTHTRAHTLNAVQASPPPFTTLIPHIPPSVPIIISSHYHRFQSCSWSQASSSPFRLSPFQHYTYTVSAATNASHYRIVPPSHIDVQSNLNIGLNRAHRLYRQSDIIDTALRSVTPPVPNILIVWSYLHTKVFQQHACPSSRVSLRP